jgi:hypothetical protein
MAAGMHPSGDAALIGESCGFLDRQRIHVGPKPDALAPVSMGKRADNASRCEPKRHLKAEAGELPCYDLAGAPFFETQLRMGMEIMPEGAEIGGMTGKPISNRQIFQWTT